MNNINKTTRTKENWIFRKMSFRKTSKTSKKFARFQK